MASFFQKKPLITVTIETGDRQRDTSNIIATLSKLGLDFSKKRSCLREFYMSSGCMEIKHTLCMMYLVVISTISTLSSSPLLSL